MRILNLGAGDRPLSMIDLGVTEGVVVNYDPGLQLDQIQQNAYWRMTDGAIYFNFVDINAGPADLLYFGSLQYMVNYFEEPFDLILAISPFDFHVISNTTNPLLRVGGKVLVIGNSSNPWIDVRFTNDLVPGIFAPGLVRNFWPYDLPDDPADPLRLIVDRIQGQYISYTTAQVQGGGAVLRRTLLNAVKSLTKNM